MDYGSKYTWLELSRVTCWIKIFAGTDLLFHHVYNNLVGIKSAFMTTASVQNEARSLYVASFNAIFCMCVRCRTTGSVKYQKQNVPITQKNPQTTGRTYKTEDENPFHCGY